MFRSFLSQKAFGDPAPEKSGSRLRRFRYSGFGNHRATVGETGPQGQGSQSRCFAGIGRPPAAIERRLPDQQYMCQWFRVLASGCGIRIERFPDRLDSPRQIDHLQGGKGGESPLGPVFKPQRSKIVGGQGGGICSIEGRTHCPVHPCQVKHRRMW